MTLRIGICVCRIVLGAVFIAASYNKILDPEAFAVAIFRYQILPGVLINLAALALPDVLVPVPNEPLDLGLVAPGLRYPRFHGPPRRTRSRDTDPVRA